MNYIALYCNIFSIERNCPSLFSLASTNNKHYIYGVLTDTFIFMHDLSLFISLALALKSRLHGIWSPPWGRSAEYYLVPVTVHL